MINDLVTILPFATPASFNGLRATLSTLPYQINVISPKDWLRTPLSEPGRAIAVFITGKEVPSQEIWIRFAELGNIPKLCILGHPSVFKQRCIIDRYDDVITWPCSAEEISYRFCRALESYPKPKCRKALDIGLIKEFIKMNLIGESSTFLQVLSLIQKAARHDITVLLLGETGTGKELAARAIHYMGHRSEQPFIPVNCGALPEEIFENEVFGHKQGAYTDAKKSQLGLVGQAQGGTLFLDEIDALSLKTQVVLLRFLQDHQYRPLGAQGYERANVRMIAASNADLGQLVENGQFRADLFFRLNILPIIMPALRERLEDLPLLTAHLIRRFRVEYGGTERFLAANSYNWMRLYPWPGNVRELENVLLRALLESEEKTLLLRPPVQLDMDNYDVGISGVDWDAKFNEVKSIVMGAFEKNYLTHVLSRVDGNITRAARLAGKERRSLGKLIKKHGLKET